MPIHWVGHRTAGHSSPPLRWLRNVTENLPNCYLIADKQMTYIYEWFHVSGVRGEVSTMLQWSPLSWGGMYTRGERTTWEPGSCLYWELAHPGGGDIREPRGTGTKAKWDILFVPIIWILKRVGTSHMAKGYAFWVLSLTVTSIV